MVQRYKPPVNFRLSSSRTATPEPFSIVAGLALLTEAPADPANVATPMIVTVSGASRTRVTTTPIAGQYRVQTQTVCDFAGISRTEFIPILEFHSSDEGLDGTADYYRTGTVLTSEWFSRNKTFRQPIIGQATLAALTAAFPPTSNPDVRGFPGDTAILTSGQFLYSDGITWLSSPTPTFTALEIADPAAPVANTGILYFRDNGSGKTQLVVRFPTGAIQVLSTEP